MRRVTPILMSIILVLVLSYEAEAKGKKKKKPKPPKTLIAKCGELVFQDEFDEKLEGWEVVQGKPKIEKGNLALTPSGSVGGAISRNFDHKDFVMEIKFRGLNKTPMLRIDVDDNSRHRMMWMVGRGADFRFWGGTLVDAHPPRLTRKDGNYAFPNGAILIAEKVGKDIVGRIGREVISAEVGADLLTEGLKLTIWGGCTQEVPGPVMVDYIRIWKAEPKKRKRR